MYECLATSNERGQSFVATWPNGEKNWPNGEKNYFIRKMKDDQVLINTFIFSFIVIAFYKSVQQQNVC